jgi:hypothetical protein
VPTPSLHSLLPEIALASALAWGSGLRLYAVLSIMGLAGWAGWVQLPEHLGILANPMVIAASGLMTAVEFGADKLPWLDSLWDAVHTFIRIPAGAALAAGVFGSGETSMSVAAAILGGTITAGTHFAKAGSRAAINTSPEPFSNWLASFTEDMAVPGGLMLAFTHPAVFLGLLALFAVLVFVLLRTIISGLSRLSQRLRTRASPTQ